MGRITMELLRKRSEHNEGEIHSLEELALHQEKLEKIELIDKVCRNLKILLLQNNAIAKIENLGRLKNLEYLNLALNIVEKVENLEGCESLRKLDLTLNFVAELTSVKTLRVLPNLEQLYLVGNPCHDYPGYRDYVVGTLPQLKSLDGREITKSERIKAYQNQDELEDLIFKLQEEYLQNRDEKSRENRETLKLSPRESAESTVSEKASNDNDDGDDEDDNEFWSQNTANTPEVRKQMIRQLEKQDEKKKPKSTKKVKLPRKLTNAEGKPFNINEGKISFSLHDECERSQLVLDLSVPKFMCTSLIESDVQPFHVKVIMKGKIFQLVLPEEVKPDSSFAQRSQTTGHLIITMPKVHNTSTVVWQGGESQRVVDLTNSGKSTSKIPPGRPANDVHNRGKTPQGKLSSPASKSKLKAESLSQLSPKLKTKSRNDKSSMKKSSSKSRAKSIEFDIPHLI